MDTEPSQDNRPVAAIGSLVIGDEFEFVGNAELALRGGPIEVAPRTIPVEISPPKAPIACDDDEDDVESTCSDDSSSSGINDLTKQNGEHGEPDGDSCSLLGTRAELDAFVRSALDDDTEGEQVRSRNEIDLATIPAPDISSISLGENDRVERAGTVLNVVDSMVVIQGAPGYPILDIESVLCLKEKQPLGWIDDLFGPVESPLYTVRLPQGLSTVEIGTPVFVVVERSRRVIPSKLDTKGTDASGKNDEEDHAMEDMFSDDDEERKAKKDRKVSKQKNAKVKIPKPSRESIPSAIYHQVQQYPFQSPIQPQYYNLPPQHAYPEMYAYQQHHPQTSSHFQYGPPPMHSGEGAYNAAYFSSSYPSQAYGYNPYYAQYFPAYDPQQHQPPHNHQ